MSDICLKYEAILPTSKHHWDYVINHHKSKPDIYTTYLLALGPYMSGKRHLPISRFSPEQHQQVLRLFYQHHVQSQVRVSGDPMGNETAKILLAAEQNFRRAVKDAAALHQ